MWLIETDIDPTSCIVYKSKEMDTYIIFCGYIVFSLSYAQNNISVKVGDWVVFHCTIEFV